MGLSEYLLKHLAKKEYSRSIKKERKAIELQDKTFKKIISLGKGSLFAKNNGIYSNMSYHKFNKSVSIGDYEGLRPYIEKISKGFENVLTKEKVKYFAVTSGTTSGAKYIPLTSRMMSYQTSAVKSLLLLYAHQTGYYNFSDSKMMFIQGSPELNYYNNVPFGKLSGITAHHIPF
jgi:hypothetical protein